ncbi:MAG: sel1 repeat family protein, partial [Treponema sp.]|nr:sel1 repeat family protein [Treponema sp.]
MEITRNNIQELIERAERGDAEAQNELGEMYYDGEGVEQDYDKAFDWFLKSAEQGNASAQMRLGFMYWCGEGVAQNYEKAFE